MSKTLIMAISQLISISLTLLAIYLFYIIKEKIKRLKDNAS